MSKLVSLVLVILLSILSVACGSKDNTTASNADQMSQSPGADNSMAAAGDVNGIIEETSASWKKAISGGYAWRDTGKILKKAEKLSQEGDAEKAQKLAMKASEQIKMAQQQYKEQEDAGPWLY
ncbi:MAG: hypothetical protein PVJ39_07425 [Gammaproteobacteria bacterium]|jgi:hypothetical protein